MLAKNAFSHGLSYSNVKKEHIELPANLAHLQNSKSYPSRTSKIGCLQKLMQSAFPKKRRNQPPGVKREFAEESNLLAGTFGEVKHEEDDEDDNEGSDKSSRLIVDGGIQPISAEAPHEYILPTDDFEVGGSPTHSKQKDSMRGNMKISIPTVSYKYIKETMFPDSRVKDQKFLPGPYPMADFGSPPTNGR